jgi:hypothetical protein
MTKTILVLAANPKDTPPLRLDQEIRDIDNGLERAQKRNEFNLKPKLAARPVDVRRAMLDYKPNIVHFCGHGSGEEGIAFEDESGQSKLISTDALSGFFELFADQVECVVLNACYSEVQAEAIAVHIKYVVGMKKAIGDKSAIEFAVAFYDALGAGKSYEFAYKLACNAIQWTDIPEYLTPILKSKINSVSDNLTNYQYDEKLKRARLHVKNRLEQRKGKRASFMAIREEVDEGYTDEFLKELIDKNPTTFRTVKVKRGELYLPGITLVSEYLHDLNETELHVLRFIRTSPSRVSVSKISEILLYSKDEVTSALKTLRDKKFLRQDDRDKVSWNHEKATYFTIPSMREQIDNALRIADSTSSRVLRAFLCYSSNDKPKVRVLYRRLFAENIDPWLDEEKLLPGQEWSQEITKAIRAADVVIVCLSRGSINKAGYVQKEIKYALDVADEQPEGAIFLIPLKLEECEVPERLKRRQWVNYFEDNGYNRLIETLRMRAQSLGISGPPERL